MRPLVGTSAGTRGLTVKDFVEHRPGTIDISYVQKAEYDAKWDLGCLDHYLGPPPYLRFSFAGSLDFLGTPPVSGMSAARTASSASSSAFIAAAFSGIT